MAHIKTVEITEEERERLTKCYRPFKDGRTYVRTIQGNNILPKEYEKHKDQIFNLKVRSDDTFVVTWPKNGTTWTQELVWCVQNDADIQTAKKLPLNARAPYLDFVFLADAMKSEDRPQHLSPSKLWQQMDEMQSPRIIKSHLTFDLLPVELIHKNKAVICLRNPKDTVVSYYHHEKLIKFHGYEGDFATYFDLFMDDLVVYGSYWRWVLEAWAQRDHPNVCMLFYEDMKRDLAGSIRKVAKFLGKELTDIQVENLVGHLSFKSMKDNPSTNMEAMRGMAFTGPKGSFIRKGEVGDWKNHFTDEMDARMNQAIEKHFKDSGLSFVYEQAL